MQADQVQPALDHAVQVSLEHDSQTYNLPAGPYLRAEIKGVTEGAPAEITLFGQTLRGNFVFEQFTRADGTTFVRVGMSGVSLALGDGASDILTEVSLDPFRRNHHRQQPGNEKTAQLCEMPRPAL